MIRSDVSDAEDPAPPVLRSRRGSRAELRKHHSAGSLENVPVTEQMSQPVFLDSPKPTHLRRNSDVNILGTPGFLNTERRSARSLSPHCFVPRPRSPSTDLSTGLTSALNPRPSDMTTLQIPVQTETEARPSPRIFTETKC